MAAPGYADTRNPFYSGQLTDDEDGHVVLTGAFVSTLFGGIHCIAWSFQFPTHSEQILWRISSLAITCGPVLGMMLNRALIIVSHHRLTPWLESLLTLLLVCMYILCLFLYFAARTILLVLAFISLRVLPPRAYETVRWTTFIPHI